MPVKIESVQSLRETARLNILITAPSGWGKTPLVGTADQRNEGGAKAIIISSDPEGAVSSAYAGGTADMIEAHTWTEIDEGFQHVRPLIMEGVYKTLIIDSGTEVQRAMMRHDIDLQYARSPQKRDKDVPSQDNYLRTQMQLVAFVKAVNALPCTTIWTAHQQELEDSEGESRYLPMFHGGKGSIATEIMGYMMIHGSGQLVDPEEDGQPAIRRLWFSNHGPYRARDRTGSLGLYMDNPTIPQIMAKLNRPKAVRPAVRRPIKKVGK